MLIRDRNKVTGKREGKEQGSTCRASQGTLLERNGSLGNTQDGTSFH
jgi:hypothetical protein